MTFALGVEPVALALFVRVIDVPGERFRGAGGRRRVRGRRFGFRRGGL